MKFNLNTNKRGSFQKASFFFFLLTIPNLTHNRIVIVSKTYDTIICKDPFLNFRQLTVAENEEKRERRERGRKGDEAKAGSSN